MLFFAFSKKFNLGLAAKMNNKIILNQKRLKSLKYLTNEPTKLTQLKHD